ncbi:uncharacterized protein LOC101823350 [Mesocricetus auratus]|uniref:Uncharacterized protein LOC101823350 n=1 Tax=Mesocricetus auratus TaxID=10036 RepID=A0ABM2X9Y5_MESAU|nr:uncharacterized protein LOC101823350 [Mesocricetus auratus]
MSDEEITYATVRFHKSSSGLQNGGRPNETQGPSEAGHRKCSVPCYLIAIPLGILCSVLLVTVALLGKHIFQYSQEKHELQNTLNNLHQEYSTMKNDSHLREEMLRNKSIEFEALRKQLDSLNRRQNRCYGETKVLDCKQRTGKRVEVQWFCFGIKCYYFFMDNKRWNGCSQTCQDCSLSLLKIDDDDELKFLQPKINPNSFWIGLSYDTRKRNWQWIDNGPSKLDLMTMKSLQEDGGCAFLSSRGIHNNKCERKHPCICEKRIQDFNTDCTLHTLKMSDEETTYTTVRFHKSSSGLQNRRRPDETQRLREVGHRECSVPCNFITKFLGILSCILLVAVAVLVIYIFQYDQENHELKKTLNNHHQKEFNIKQNDSYLKDEMLRNKSTELEALKKYLDSLNRKQNRCHGETKVVLDCKQPSGKHVEAQWFCCGIKCYYFIMDKESWNGCKQTCQDCSLSLLKIEDDDELKFLQLQINPKSHWIGLSYDTRRKWQWIDDSLSKLDLNIMNFNPNSRRCAFLSKTRIDDAGCDQLYHCVCEKRLSIP